MVPGTTHARGYTMAARKASTKTAPATENAPATEAAPATGPLVQYNPDASQTAKTLARPGTARHATVVMAKEFDGKPLAEFKAAWLAAAAAGQVHHDTSKFTLGTTKSGKPHEPFGGWWGWLVKSGVCTQRNPS